MAHRAGTGDAPIPGLVTSRRNPAYKLKPRPKEQTQPLINAGSGRDRRDKGSKRKKSPSPRRPSPERRDPEEERRSRERREQAEDERREREEAEKAARKQEEEEEAKRRWAEQEARWAEERRIREEQRKLEEERRNTRKSKLKGAFTMDEDDHEDEAERARELAQQQKRKNRTEDRAPALITPLTAQSLSLPGESRSRPQIDNSNTDAVSLRASLADPSAARTHNPGEVAEHFRRLSEMKRKFRRAEFGGPDRSVREREQERKRSRSRSGGGREKYNSVWIRR